MGDHAKSLMQFVQGPGWIQLALRENANDLSFLDVFSRFKMASFA